MPDEVPVLLPNAPANAPSPQPSLLTSLKASVRTQSVSWLVAVIFGILSIFSTQITESIRHALNSADQNSKYYEELSSDLSGYVFQAELIEESIRSGWTSKGAIDPLINEYNSSVTKFRSKEYVYLSWVDRYWKQNNKVEQLAAIIAEAKRFDQVIHTLNDEIEAVSVKKTKEKIDPIIGKHAAEQARPILDGLQNQVRLFLISLRP